MTIRDFAMEAITRVDLQLKRGHVAAVMPDGQIRIKAENAEGPIDCLFLRTSAAPLPEISPGDEVAFITDETKRRGYILGLIEKNPSGELNGIEKGESVRTLQIRAEERIELRCGKSSLIMRADGTVIMKGTKVVSRARGVNKIKGAAVQIN